MGLAQRSVWVLNGAVAAVVLVIGGCSEPSAADPSSGRFDGLYRQGFEQSAFYPDGGGGPYWMDYTEAVGPELQAHVQRKAGQRGSHITVRLAVEGTLESGGGFGHLGRYEGRLTATRVLTIEPIDDATFFARAELEHQPDKDDGNNRD